jgi:hypothetical protein
MEKTLFMKDTRYLIVMAGISSRGIGLVAFDGRTSFVRNSRIIHTVFIWGKRT